MRRNIHNFAGDAPIAAIAVAMFVWLTGCTADLARPPENVAELTNQQTHEPNAYTHTVILLHNLRRTLDPDLSSAQRMASLAVVERLGERDENVHLQLAVVLTEQDSPEDMRIAVLELLARQGYQGLGPYIAEMLRRPQTEPLRDILLNWLIRNPGHDVLAEVTKSWAQEPRNEDTDVRYSLAIEMMTGRNWVDSLLHAMNQEAFLARGSALELLATRLSPGDLRGRIMNLPAVSTAVQAMQYFIQRLDYLPTQKNELLATVMIFSMHRTQLESAAELADEWASSCGYEFNIRDFHLLSRLKADPIRRLNDRSELIVLLGGQIGMRQHGLGGEQAGSANQPELAPLVSRLSMADLANLYLLNEMLTRPRVLAALRVMAEKDRADRATRWGGLIFYENNRAEARLYPPGETLSGTGYALSDRAIQDSINSLAILTAHFEKPANSAAIAPSPEELETSKRVNCYGLVLISLSKSTFMASYYNPDGMVVGLGTFLFDPESAATKH